MPILLDHTIVPSHDKAAGARLLGELLERQWLPAEGEFAPVYVDDSLTFDFQDRDEFSWNHYCFQVSDDDFDAIFSRIKEKGIGYRSSPRGPNDSTVRTRGGGKNIYWTCPDSHIWEILTVSYARMAAAEPSKGSSG